MFRGRCDDPQPRLNLDTVATHGRLATRAVREAARVAWDNREVDLCCAFNVAARAMEDAMGAFERRRAAVRALVPAPAP